MSMFPFIKELQRISVYLIFLHVIKATTEQQSGNLFVLSVSGTLSAKYPFACRQFRQVATNMVKVENKDFN